MSSHDLGPFGVEYDDLGGNEFLHVQHHQRDHDPRRLPTDHHRRQGHLTDLQLHPAGCLTERRSAKQDRRSGGYLSRNNRQAGLRGIDRRVDRRIFRSLDDRIDDLRDVDFLDRFTVDRRAGIEHVDANAIARRIPERRTPDRRAFRLASRGARWWAVRRIARVGGRMRILDEAGIDRELWREARILDEAGIDRELWWEARILTKPGSIGSLFLVG